ncbi:MAG: thioredoxin [Actinomycetota bacterium]
MPIDVTDATFAIEVVERSKQVPVVVDLWADWCGPCKQLGPILEKVIDETAGKVVLAKVDVDSNRQIAGAFQVQGIPAVYALRDGKVVDHFVGAVPESTVRAFVESLLPSEAEDAVGALVAAGDETSLRGALDIEPGHEVAILRLAELLVDKGDAASVSEALGLLERIPESAETRRVAALARVGSSNGGVDPTTELDSLLARVKDDEEARQRYLDLLEVMGAADPRTADYRKRLTNQLF